MAGLAALLTKSALDAALAGTAAKGTLDMNKKKEESPFLDTGLLSKSENEDEKKVEKKVEEKKEPEYKTLSKNDLDDLMIMLVEGGLSTPEAKKIIKTGYISEDALGKLSPDAIKGIEGLTGVSMAFPTGDKPEGTPPVTGTTVEKQTRTETPDGEVRETTTTFDSNNGVEKSSKTEIPEVDWSELFPNIDEISTGDIREDDPRIIEIAKQKGVLPETIARLVRANLRTQESLRNGKSERTDKAKRIANEANRIHGKTAEIDAKEVMPSHLTRAEQNQVRHESQKRWAETQLRAEERAKNALLHKDQIK